MSKSLGTALRSAILRGSAFHFKFNPPQQPLLSLPSRIQVARLHQVSNSSRNKKLESIFVRRLFHASRPLRQHHDQGPPPPLQSNLKHVGAGAVLTLIAVGVGGVYYYMYGRKSERKAVIKMSGMSEDMQQDAFDCATQAFEKYNMKELSDIATFIKKEFDKKYNPTWQVIVGPHFGSSTRTNNTKHFIFFDYGQVGIYSGVGIVLFKSE